MIEISFSSSKFCWSFSSLHPLQKHDISGVQEDISIGAYRWSTFPRTCLDFGIIDILLGNRRVKVLWGLFWYRLLWSACHSLVIITEKPSQVEDLSVRWWKSPAEACIVSSATQCPYTCKDHQIQTAIFRREKKSFWLCLFHLKISNLVALWHTLFL